MSFEPRDYLRHILVEADYLIGRSDGLSCESLADETLRAVVVANHWSRVIVVTSKQHTRRARLVMNRRLADTDATAILRASRYDKTNVDAWWRERGTVRFTLFETQRLIAYWLRIAD